VRFLDDPRIPIDTNLLERGMRALAIGRKYADVAIMQTAFGGARAGGARCGEVLRIIRGW
jgi:hypothetical protein